MVPFKTQTCVPTPEMSMSFAISKDPCKWSLQFTDGDRTWIVCELVPEGQIIEDWKEMVAQQIAFTKNSIGKHVKEWKALLRHADPQIEIKEERNEDGSILVTYTSLEAREMSMRRFIQAKDGVYMLAYNVRPALKNEDRVKLWLEILKGAHLVPNPEKAMYPFGPN